LKVVKELFVAQAIHRVQPIAPPRPHLPSSSL
jgi:hypothetical protein